MELCLMQLIVEPYELGAFVTNCTSETSNLDKEENLLSGPSIESPTVAPEI